MKINCNYPPQEGCENCNFNEYCPLIQPSHINLINIRKEIVFKLNQLELLNNGIITMATNIKAVKQGLVDFVSLEECESILTDQKNKKKEMSLDIRDLRKRERNILKVIERRIQNEKFQNS